jgi:hypothetical protein
MPDPATDQSRIDASLFIGGALVTQDYLLEGITQTPEWGRVDVAATRAALAGIFARFPHDSQPNEPTTENDLIWPVLAALGWTDWLTQQNLSSTGRVDVPDGLLFIDAAAKARANEHPEEWRRYSHGAAVIESKRWGRALDRAEGRKGADKDTPSTQLLRYLRRIDDLTNGSLRWGILTNGAKWRLYFAGARSTIDDYLEIDLARIMRLDDDLLDSGITDADRDHWLRVFAVMFSRAAFERATATAPSFHDRARREAAFYEQRVAKSLSDLVFQRLYPMLGKAVAKAAPADTTLDDVRQATLILLYRLLFILYAEDRGLLPVKDTRFDDYALRMARLDIGRRRDAGDTFSSVAKTIWNRFADLSLMIDKGDASVGLPPYNGGLFSTEQTPLLASIALPDEVMAEALDILSFEELDGRRRYINYRDLSVQQLGSIYERLLEFELTRDATGAVDVRPNIFARKNSGSYYTPDDLVLLIIDETLAPLIEDAMQAFRDALAAVRPKDNEDYRITQLQKSDPAKAITRLRICDPAMGSGHFLVSLVDRLTNHTLTAIAEAAVLASARGSDLGIDLDYESPVSEEIRKVRGTIRHNAEDAGWTVSEEQLDDPQLVKRMVLKRCVYGADKNPMAVELAKVALWLHTFTVGAPLSFIDHHLAAGDSLFGLWVRDAIDKAGKGGELLYVEELRNAERQAGAMQRIEALTDAEIAEAHSSAMMWRDVEMQVGPLDGFVSFMHALDWLDLKGPDKALVSLWLDGQFGDPIPIARGKKAPEAYRAKPEEVERFADIWQAARELIGEERFLNWQITFPGVWQNWAGSERKGGFDAVIGNPPWDRFEFEEVPWFEARDKGIALAPSGAKRKAAIRSLKDKDAPLWAEYIKATERMAMATRVAKVKNGAKIRGIYSRLNGGKLNLYKLFVERAHMLVHPTGVVGLLTPSGVASDLSASAFFRQLATGGQLKALFDFENRRTRYGLEPFFPDVDTRFKFVAMVASPERKFPAARCGFFLQAVSEIQNPDRAFPISAADFARVNPNTGTAPIFRTRRDMALTTAIYARLPVLVDKSGDIPVAAWPVKYSQMINMTSDSHLFRTRVELEEAEGAWPVGGNRWQSASGEWVPLYEGKMVQAFDHRAASVVINPENVNRPAQPLQATPEQSADPAWLADPQFWILPPDGLAKASYALGFKDVTAPTNVRTMIAAIAPSGAAGNTLPLIDIEASSPLTKAVAHAHFAANLNCVAFDFVARQKVQGQHLNWYIVEQLPVVPPAAYTRAFGPKTAAEIVREAVLELTYTAHDMAPFARDMGHVVADGPDAGAVLPPFTWNEDRRLHLRAKLDALYFILYGIFDPADPAHDPAQARDDVRYIYSTFPIVERQERAAYAGKYRSRDLALSYINALLAGQPDAQVAG